VRRRLPKAARRAAAGEAGRLRLAPPDFGARAAVAAEALARFRECRPLVDVQLVPLPWTAHVEALCADQLDAGFAIGASVADYPEAVVAERVGEEALAWALLPGRAPARGGARRRAGHARRARRGAARWC
jgi:DNA-binding transcriptional LysR family regulator